MTRFNMTLSALAFAAAGLFAVGTANARGGDNAEACQGQKEHRKGKLTAEERAERKAKLAAMTPEERAAHKAERKARKAEREAEREADE